MNTTRRSPIVLLIALVALLPMSVFATVQIGLVIIGKPMIMIGGEDVEIVNWITRLLPWAMCFFAPYFGNATESMSTKRLIAILLLVFFNISLYRIQWFDVSWLTLMGSLYSMFTVLLINSFAIILYLFRKNE